MLNHLSKLAHSKLAKLGFELWPSDSRAWSFHYPASKGPTPTPRMSPKPINTV